MKKYTNRHNICGLSFAFAMLLSVVFATSAYAQSPKSGYPVFSSNKIIRLTPSESKILHLSNDAGSVVVTNPVHASVFLDTPRLLVIVPGAPGATSFVILDRSGNEIMRRDVIVSGRNNKNKYVRIQRVCNDATEGCVPSSIYYCPDGCHQVSTVAAESAGGIVSSSTASSTSSYDEEVGE